MLKSPAITTGTSKSFWIGIEVFHLLLRMFVKAAGMEIDYYKLLLIGSLPKTTDEWLAYDLGGQGRVQKGLCGSYPAQMSSIKRHSARIVL